MNLIKQMIYLQFILIMFTVGMVQANNSYHDLLQTAKQYFEEQDFEKAKETLFLALKKNEAGYEANKLLGDIYFKDEQWKLAQKAYEKTFTNMPENTYAHFRIGICERERGRYQNPVSRRFTFKSAAQHFKKVIHEDPFYEMVYYEYAELELYREHFREAIDLCLTGMRIQPRDMKSKQDIYKYYDFYLEEGEWNSINPLSNPDQAQLKWLLTRNNAYDRFIVGEKYRRMGLFEKADSVFTHLLENPLDISKIPIYLARVRLYNQMGRDEEAELDYWAALDKVRSYYEFQFFFEETKFIMSDSDLQIRLPNMIAIRQFYQRFWSSHNTFPGSSTNLRLAEHYRRLVYAEKNYRFYEKRMAANTPDFGRILEFPDIFFKNQKYNDKGLVYLRYGQPDDIAVSPSGGFLSNESWLYHETTANPKLIFHFEVHRDAKPNDWRLVALPSQYGMLESRLGWDVLLDSYYTASSEMDQMAAVAQIQMDSQEKIREAMDRQRPFSMKQIQPMYLSVDPVQFWNELGSAYLDINIAIPSDQLKSATAEGNTATYETGFAILDSLGNILEKGAHQFDGVTDTQSAYYIRTFKTFPSENNVIIAVHVREPENNRIGGLKFKMALRQQSKAGPEISDLLLATDIKPALKIKMQTHQGLEIHPNPSGRFNRSEPVFLYYEIYNLNSGEGLRRYNIEQTIVHLEQSHSLFSRLYSVLFKGNPQRLSISRESQSMDKIAIEYGGIDFSKWEPGPVEITIQITDLFDGTQTKRSKQMLLE